MRTRLVSALATLLLLSACGGETGSKAAQSPAETEQSPSATAPDSAPAASASPESDPPSGDRTKKPTPTVPPGPRITTGASEFGKMLFDGRGQAIYLFDLEEGRPRPECYGECAAAWPPVLTDGEPVAGSGIRAKRLGTTRRRDGSLQVTYHGHPLYFYAHEGVGEVLCHDFEDFGGTWFVVQPNGDAAP